MEAFHEIKFADPVAAKTIQTVVINRVYQLRAAPGKKAPEMPPAHNARHGFAQSHRHVQGRRFLAEPSVAQTDALDQLPGGRLAGQVGGGEDLRQDGQ